MKQRGLTTWFDEEMMDKMTEGIDNCACVCVIACITTRYVDKVSGRGTNKDKDNCLFEYVNIFACLSHTQTASINKGASNMIPMDKVSGRDTTCWYDMTASVHDGGSLYVCGILIL